MTDWRDSVPVRIVAVALLVVGVVLVVRYVGGGGGSKAAEGAQPPAFKCDTRGKTFAVKATELKDPEVHQRYLNRFDEAAACRECGEEAAYQVYLCRKRGDKYYRYTKADGIREMLRCPEKHEIPTADQ